MLGAARPSGCNGRERERERNNNAFNSVSYHIHYNVHVILCITTAGPHLREFLKGLRGFAFSPGHVRSTRHLCPSLAGNRVSETSMAQKIIVYVPLNPKLILIMKAYILALQLAAPVESPSFVSLVHKISDEKCGLAEYSSPFQVLVHALLHTDTVCHHFAVANRRVP